MYCTFEACSSLVVEKRAVPTFTQEPLNPGTSVTRKVLNLAEENTKQLRNLNLMELIRSEDEGNFVQTISRVRCRVTIVQKASLRWLCKRCGELVTRNECVGGCYSAVGYKFHAEARYASFRCSNICRARLFWAFVNPRLLFDRLSHHLNLCCLVPRRLFSSRTICLESTGASVKVSVCSGDVTRKDLRARPGKNLYGNQARIFALDFLVANIDNYMATSVKEFSNWNTASFLYTTKSNNFTRRTT